MRNNSDLHAHSIFSDGAFSPKELVRKAKRAKIKNLALTDHNSIDGIKEAINEGGKIGVNVIPAIEIRAEENEVLGYFIDYKDKKFLKALGRIRKTVLNRVKKIVRKLKKQGIEIEFSDLKREFFPNKNLMEVHIAFYLQKRGFGTVQQIWDRFISRKGSAFVPIKELSIVEAIKIIKAAGGVAVLAHPWLQKETMIEGNIAKYAWAGVQGIEVNNGDSLIKGRTPEAVAKVKRFAKKYSLVMTLGSDFHSNLQIKELKSHYLGKYNCGQEIVSQLLSLSGKKSLNKPKISD